MIARLTLRQLGFKLLVAAFSLVLLSACGEGSSVAGSFKDEFRAPSDARLLYDVTSVDVAVMESQPLQLRVSAQGHSRTGGWSAPALVLDEDASGEDVLVFRLVAVRPTGMATQAITPIAATTDFGPWTDGMAQEIRVVAETNSESFYFSDNGDE